MKEYRVRITTSANNFESLEHSERRYYNDMEAVEKYKKTPVGKFDIVKKQLIVFDCETGELKTIKETTI